MTRLLGLCGALLATGAAAQEEDAAATEAPRWSVGGGIGYGYASGAAAAWGYLDPYYYGGLGSLGILGPTAGLAPRASLEYQLSEGLALTLDATAFYSRASGSNLPVALTNRGASMGVGLRRVVAGQAATRVSVHGQLQASVSRWESQASGFVPMEPLPPGQEPPAPRTREDRLGARIAGGLAVERDLLDTLSVRLGADVVGVGFVRGKLTPPVGPTSLGRRFIAELTFSPSLELRLAF